MNVILIKHLKTNIVQMYKIAPSVEFIHSSCTAAQTSTALNSGV